MTDVTKKPFLGFWEVDLAKQLTFDFPELAVLLGYQITECAGGWSFLKLVIDPTQLFRLKRSFLAAGTSPFKQKLNLKHKNGTQIYLAVIGRARMSQAGHIRIEGTIEDITDYKSEKEVLWLANRQLASFIHQLPMAIAIIDDDEKYIAASNVWKVHFNLEHTEVAGESHYNMFPGTPKIWKQYHRRAMEGEHIKMEEDSFLDRYGNTDWIQWEIKPWFSISQELAGMMGSKIGLTSKLGQGSIFSLILDLKKCLAAALEQSITDPAQQNLHGLRVLIVEDQQINTMVLKTFLMQWNCICSIAENGKIATEMVKANDYDLVLMDLQMPEMDGYQATKTIRQLVGAKYCSLPILGLTASAVPSIKGQILDAGMNGVLGEPFEPKELLDLINEVTRIDLRPQYAMATQA